MTYTAGLSPPGGFWLDTQHGHRAGDPALMVHYRARFIAFFLGNTTAFFASLFSTPWVLTSFTDSLTLGDLRLLVFLGKVFNFSNNIAQCGLVIAYAAGSNMDIAYIAYVLLGGFVVPLLTVLIFVMTQSLMRGLISKKWRPILEEWFQKRVNKR